MNLNEDVRQMLENLQKQINTEINARVRSFNELKSVMNRRGWNSNQAVQRGLDPSQNPVLNGTPDVVKSNLVIVQGANQHTYNPRDPEDKIIELLQGEGGSVEIIQGGYECSHDDNIGNNVNGIENIRFGNVARVIITDSNTTVNPDLYDILIRQPGNNLPVNIPWSSIEGYDTLLIGVVGNPNNQNQLDFTGVTCSTAKQLLIAPYSLESANLPNINTINGNGSAWLHNANMSQNNYVLELIVIGRLGMGLRHQYSNPWVIN
jgi:hypothetical protein